MSKDRLIGRAPARAYGLLSRRYQTYRAEVDRRDVLHRSIDGVEISLMPNRIDTYINGQHIETDGMRLGLRGKIGCDFVVGKGNVK